MKRRWKVVFPVLVFEAWILALSCLSAGAQSTVQTKPGHIVRLAELEIDPAQLENYKAALIEEITTSIRVEPGVLTLYAVALKDNPSQIRLFEIYADAASYEAHLQSPHFRKYKAATQGMVRSLKLAETEPIVLGAKGD